MRTVAISGASRGIGWATAKRFRDAGDLVFNLDIDKPESGTDGVVWIPTDVANWDAVATAITRIHHDSNQIDVVVANAGISIRHGVLDITEAEARRIVDVNLFGVLAMWQAAARLMVEQGHGVLLATASVNGHRGYPFYADYNATKAGIAALCRTFALELSPGIRTACVSPGAVLTPMQLVEYSDEMLADVNRKIPAGRHAAPAEIADAFFYLASAQARFVTGQELVIDGGETAGATTSAFGTGARVPRTHSDRRPEPSAIAI